MLNQSDSYANQPRLTAAPVLWVWDILNTHNILG